MVHLGYHTEPRYRMVQRMAIFLVPLVQWLIAAVVGMVLLVMWLLSRPLEVGKRP
jgi:hypothetical protein